MENTIIQPLPKKEAFRGQILRQVYRVWLVRKFLPVLIGEIIVLSLLLYQAGRIVFVQRILENAFNVLFNNPEGIVNFGVTAFSNAPTSTKLFALAVTVFLALIIRRLTQGVLRLILVRENYFGKTEK
ncbi:MAG: hypothetical protein A2847_01360 [Candidatus Sungbacteria bacterium RIFCSPHIGHO2_01_FULL_50_25]|uniref:Uncharacterized protein n=1 Tax=Candidatus Sungbacteria bacterium RIFCSPHIGHO2_01_FULL_50_25 TaxID=1802265 RepID=A0A1G2K6P0_9BACT|nr:MAG: hypothetical protein A2847_01360 [Candidatus Sungbacteria bacterium RIFCSPHIGHO2_01_FULL_50_25]